MRKRRTEITIETRKLTIIRTSVRKSDLIGCPLCRRNVSPFSKASALAIFGLKARDLEDLTSSGKVHWAGNSDLCGDSISKYFDIQQVITEADHDSEGMALFSQNLLGEI